MEYELHLKTPYGTYQIEANSFEALAALAAANLTEMTCSQLNQDIDLVAMDVQRAYQDSTGFSGNHGNSRIAMAGLELDLIKCYVQGMLIAEAIEWLRINKDFKTSRSAVGRYWVALSKISAARKIHK